MYRAIITLGGLQYLSKNCNTKDEAETWILEVSEKQEVKRADIFNKKTKERERIL